MPLYLGITEAAQEYDQRRLRHTAHYIRLAPDGQEAAAMEEAIGCTLTRGISISTSRR
jgi:hypothetical protein